MLRSIYQRVLAVFRTNTRRASAAPQPSSTVGGGKSGKPKTVDGHGADGGSIGDGSFEAPALPGYQGFRRGAALSSPWTFTGISGVSTKNSAFTTGDPDAPRAPRWPSSRTAPASAKP